MMTKQVAALNTTWHDMFRLKYAQIRPENNFWHPPTVQLKNFVKPSDDHYAYAQAKMTQFTRFQILLKILYSDYFSI